MLLCRETTRQTLDTFNCLMETVQAQHNCLLCIKSLKKGSDACQLSTQHVYFPPITILRQSSQWGWKINNESVIINKWPLVGYITFLSGFLSALASNIRNQPNKRQKKNKSVNCREFELSFKRKKQFSPLFFQLLTMKSFCKHKIRRLLVDQRGRI